MNTATAAQAVEAVARERSYHPVLEYLSDLRHDGVVLGLQDREADTVTARETRLARQITEALRGAGYATSPGLDGPVRSVQMLEIAKR